MGILVKGGCLDSTAVDAQMLRVVGLAGFGGLRQLAWGVAGAGSFGVAVSGL
jgi:hypothetical protein